MKRFLIEEGHTAVVVAPVDNESGQGGRSVFTTSKTLTKPSEFNLVSAGAPSLGRDPNDPDVWYAAFSNQARPSSPNLVQSLLISAGIITELRLLVPLLRWITCFQIITTT
jgi:hypothetical protein